MKTKTIINTGFCIFSILLSTLSWSQNETPKADFRNVNWGMTRNQVIAAEEGRKPFSDFNGTLQFKAYDFFGSKEMTIIYRFEPNSDRVVSIEFGMRNTSREWTNKQRSKWINLISEHIGVKYVQDPLRKDENYAIQWNGKRSIVRLSYSEARITTSLRVVYRSSKAMKDFKVFTHSKEGGELSIEKLGNSFETIKSSINAKPFAETHHPQIQSVLLYLDLTDLWGHTVDVSYTFFSNRLISWSYSHKPADSKIYDAWKNELTKLFGRPQLDDANNSRYVYGKMIYTLTANETSTNSVTGQKSTAITLAVLGNPAYKATNKPVTSYPAVNNIQEGFGYEEDGTFSQRPLSQGEKEYLELLSKYSNLTGTPMNKTADAYDRLFVFNKNKVKEITNSVWKAKNSGADPLTVEGSVSGFTDWKEIYYDVILSTADPEDCLNYFYNMELNRYGNHQMKANLIMRYGKENILPIAKMLASAPKSKIRFPNFVLPIKLADPVAFDMPERKTLWQFSSALEYLLEKGNYAELNKEEKLNKENIDTSNITFEVGQKLKLKSGKRWIDTEIVSIKGNTYRVMWFFSGTDRNGRSRPMSKADIVNAMKK